jgi:syntaxin-binding protein 1
MDIVAPLIHEFTYQAMAHDLLPIKENDKIFYKTVVNDGPDQEEKEMEIGEHDEIWVKNRHTHMKDTIDRLMGDFQKFINDNPHFTEQADPTSLNTIKDMLAGLPQFQKMKEAYSLHLSMAQECMSVFQRHKLPDVAQVEQTVATGVDEDYRKPKNVADQLVRLLDDESITPSDRLRLIILYVLYRDGVIFEDITRLLAHAGLPAHDAEILSNLELLGTRTIRPLKDTKPTPTPLFPRKLAAPVGVEEYSISRFEPALKLLLEDLVKGTLDASTFPYIKAPMASEADLVSTNASLRSAKPTWAQNRRSVHESKQRIIIFMAGGATYSESRACYEISRSTNRDVILATSHMQTPALFIRQVGDLSVDRRKLDLPMERPKKQAPAHLFERSPSPQAARKPVGMQPPGAAGLPPGPKAPQASGGRLYAPPTSQIGSMTLNSNGQKPVPITPPQPPPVPQGAKGGKLEKKTKDDGEKKKRGFFSSKK